MPPQRKPRGPLRELAPLLAVVAVIATARSSLADHYFVPSESMLPTVHAGDHIVVNKAAYGARLPFTSFTVASRSGPARGDVVVLTDEETGATLLKRVVALPGDRVEVRHGRVVLNGVEAEVRGDGEVLDRGAHPVSLSDGGGPDFGPVVMPSDGYLVLGDNRGNSRDGRSFGVVPRQRILGRAAAVVARDGVPTYLRLLAGARFFARGRPSAAGKTMVFCSCERRLSTWRPSSRVALASSSINLSGFFFAFGSSRSACVSHGNTAVTSACTYTLPRSTLSALTLPQVCPSPAGQLERAPLSTGSTQN